MKRHRDTGSMGLGQGATGAELHDQGLRATATRCRQCRSVHDFA